jgi:rhamnosyltransferase subunit B
VAQRLERRAIFLTPNRAQVPAALPPSVLWQQYLPLKKLLPHAAALIHHGGIGTTAEALRAGVPQLVVPLAFDQFDNGARVAAFGVGLTLPHARLSTRSLLRKLEQLLSSSAFALHADALSTHLSPPPSLDSLLDAISILISKTGKN